MIPRSVFEPGTRCPGLSRVGTASRPTCTRSCEILRDLARSRKISQDLAGSRRFCLANLFDKFRVRIRNFFSTHSRQPVGSRGVRCDLPKRSARAPRRSSFEKGQISQDLARSRKICRIEPDQNPHLKKNKRSEPTIFSGSFLHIIFRRRAKYGVHLIVSAISGVGDSAYQRLDVLV